MNGTPKVIIALFLVVLIGAVGAFTAYFMAQPRLEDSAAVTGSGKSEDPSSVFAALNPKTIAAGFIENPDQVSQIEDSKKTDANEAVYRKYYETVFEGGGVQQFVAQLHDELTSKQLDDEIESLKRFEQDIPTSINQAGGSVTATNSRRGTQGDSIQTRYCFDYDCKNARGAIRVWILARNDQCTIIILVTEHIT